MGCITLVITIAMAEAVNLVATRENTIIVLLDHLFSTVELLLAKHNIQYTHVDRSTTQYKFYFEGVHN